MRVLVRFLLFIMFLFSLSCASYKRGPAPKVEPLVYNGVEYRVPNEPQNIGVVEAWDLPTNKKKGDYIFYRSVYNPFLERDVQWNFIQKIWIDDTVLSVQDEKGKVYYKLLKTRKSKREKAKGDVREL